jgi:hypothetical protein
MPANEDFKASKAGIVIRRGNRAGGMWLREVSIGGLGRICLNRQ